jgi:hypothetical protein
MLKRLLILLLLCASHFAFCQSSDNRGQENKNLDENLIRPADQQVQPTKDTTTIVSNAFFDIFYGKPGKAAFYGLIVPGGGQIYNKKWWKLPFVYAIEGFSLYWVITSTKQNGLFQEAYFNVLNDLEGPRAVRGISDVNALLANRNKWRKNKEYSWIIFMGAHLITIFESFIDRHLMEFDVSDDLTFAPVQSVVGPYPAFTYTIGLNKKKDIVFKDLLVD